MAKRKEVTGIKSRKSSIAWIGLGMCLSLCLLFSRQAPAQADEGTITGVVQDSTGAVIPNATVTISNTDTGLVLQHQTDASGIYVFSPLKIGNYRVRATAPGFQTTSQEGLRLNVQERLNVAIKLNPGQISQTVTVSTAPPLLQTQSGSTGQVMSTNTINNTPLNGRNWVFIAQLAAGVSPSSGSTRGSGTGDFYANGQLAGQNDFILDGVDDNANLADLMNGSSFTVRPPPDALAEFKVDTGNYSAEFGHSAGAVINASLKSGTNQIHGDLWEYFRNDVLDARDFDALTVPEYRENQFGATLGFPLIRNKLFFFGDNESNRIVSAAPTTLSVPTPLMRQGNFTEILTPALTGSASPIKLYEPNSGGTAPLACTGQQNVFCPAQIDPVARNLLDLYPSPNTNNGKTYSNYTTNLPQLSDTWQWDTRVDWNASAKDLLYARFSYLHIPAYVTPPLGTILDGSPNFVTGHQSSLAEGFMFSETHIFGPSLTNEFRLGYNYGKYSFLQVNSGVDLAPTLGLGGIPYGAGFPDNGGLPSVTIGSLTAFGTHSYNPSIEGQNVYQILDNVTKTVGNHVLKFGVDLQSIRIAVLQPTYSHGSYTFSGLYTSDLNASFTGYGVADFLADQNHAASISNSSQTNDVRWYRAGYAQDDWRLKTNLTLNLGVRYDFYQPFKENAGRQATYHTTGPLGVGTGSAVYQIPAQSQNVPLVSAFTNLLAQNNISLQYLANPHLINAQYANISPRVGFAYSVNPITIVHGGFGTFYGGLQSLGYGPNLGGNYPFEFQDNYVAANCLANNCPAIGITLEQGFSQALSEGLQNFISTPSLRGSDATAKTSYSIDYNLTVQRAFSNNLVATISYVGNEGRHLIAATDPNNAEALQNPANNVQLARPFPGFGGTSYTSYAGVSTYNSLQATLEKRYTSGLSFLATYTWSHSLDDAPPILGPVGGAPGGTDSYRNSNLIPIIDDYTNSNFDTRHRFNFNGFYELPVGRGRAHLGDSSRLTDLIVGGWATNLTFSAETGQPISVSSNITTAVGGTAFAILTGNPFEPGGTPNSTNPSVSCAARTRTVQNWYNPCAFSNPLPGSNIPASGPNSKVTDISQVIAYLGGKRNQITGPGYERTNMSLFKNFTTVRSQYLQFRADIFNVLNTPGYGDPSVTGINSNGGQITTARSFQNFTPDARFFQFSLKYVF